MGCFIVVTVGDVVEIQGGATKSLASHSGNNRAYHASCNADTRGTVAA